MNSRLDHDQDNAILTQIRDLQADVTELKSRQSINRSLVKRTYPVSSTSTWDYAADVIPANTNRFYYFTATGDGSQDRPYGMQYSQVYNGGTDSAHRMSDYGLNDSTGTNYHWINNPPGTTTGIMQWIVVVQTGSSGATIYLKFRGLLSCPAIRLTTFKV